MEIELKGNFPVFSGDAVSGTFKSYEGLPLTGSDDPKESRIFYTDLSLTGIAAGNSVSGTLLTFANCIGFKINQVQFWAYKTTSADIYGAIDLMEWTINGVDSGQSYPGSSRTYGTGVSGYNNFFKVAQDPDFHTMNFDGPIYVQQGKTFSITYKAYSTFSLNDIMKAGVTITWQEL